MILKPSISKLLFLLLFLGTGCKKKSGIEAYKNKMEKNVKAMQVSLVQYGLSNGKKIDVINTDDFFKKISYGGSKTDPHANSIKVFQNDKGIIIWVTGFDNQFGNEDDIYYYLKK